MILTAAALDFLGLGLQPPAPECGAMLYQARPYLRTAPHLLFPGLALFLAALACHLLGRALDMLSATPFSAAHQAKAAID